jgi:hypothetical protein
MDVYVSHCECRCAGGRRSNLLSGNATGGMCGVEEGMITLTRVRGLIYTKFVISV